MPEETLESISKQVEKRDFDSPPLHLWHPPLSGDIPIRINADGAWFHEGDEIRRESLVRLFASILRREEDGEYYLVTPVEKWRVDVELHPLIVIDVDRAGKSSYLQATLNTGKTVELNEEGALFLEEKVGHVAAIRLPHGLSALFSRTAWYRLAELAEEENGCSVVRSGEFSYKLTQGFLKP
jgi:uncharacterized protein